MSEGDRPDPKDLVLQTLQSLRAAGVEVRHTSEDGSDPFLGIDSTFIVEHLSPPDISILLYHMGTGKDFSSLTEADVVNLFL
jgi:hypothetical protein